MKQLSTRWFISCVIAVATYALSTTIYKFLVASTDRLSTPSISAIEECHPPYMTIENSKINNFFYRQYVVKCTAIDNWIYLADGKIFYNKTVITTYNLSNIDCKVIFFRRETESTNFFHPAVTINDGFVMMENFFFIACTAERGWRYKNWHLGVARHDDVIRRLENLRSANLEPKWNVYYIGLDSTSRLAFMRTMPITYNYLIKNLSAIVMKLYNIVGDGTINALTPMLTGRQKQELPNTEKTDKNASYVNVYPFVWNNFSAAGYTTMFAEDSPTAGEFYAKNTGFNESPVDFYSMNFWMSVNKNISRTAASPQQCLGGRLTIQTHIDQFRQFFDVYKDYPKYVFSITDVGHENNNINSHFDVPLMEHLRHMKESGHLDQTVLVVFGDHGARYQNHGNLRITQDGKMEERLPFHSFVLPESFKQLHPKAVANMKVNAERLVTPFDAYATALSLLGNIDTGVGSLKNRGISMFQEIPRERQCADAGIGSHFCTCQKWYAVKTDDRNVQKSVQEILLVFNGETEQYRNTCIPLQLGTIKSAWLSQPPKEIMYHVPGTDDKLIKNYSAVSTIMYQIVFDTKPGGNVYEVTVHYDINESKIFVDLKTVSVLTSYRENGYCIFDIDKTKERFCICNPKFA